MRSIIYWWLLGHMDRDWWSPLLGQIRHTFPRRQYQTRPTMPQRSILLQAFQFATRLGGLVVSRDTEIELKQAASKDSGEAFELFHRVANEEISKSIGGQTLSSDAKAAGMGSGVAEEPRRSPPGRTRQRCAPGSGPGRANALLGGRSSPSTASRVVCQSWCSAAIPVPTKRPARENLLLPTSRSQPGTDHRRSPPAHFRAG